MEDLTSEKLRELLSYDPDTGQFFWKVYRSANYGPRSKAGSISKSGYVKIGISGRLYPAHRLAWFHFFGKWPDGVVDHINGQQGDNRISNLRDVTHAQNLENLKRARSDNKCGLLGASLHKKTGKWRAQIVTAGAHYSLGLYDTPEQAHCAYVLAKRVLHSANTL